MHRSQPRALALTASLGAALALSGCGGVMKFSDSTPISITGPAPEEPPPPPKRVEVKQDRIEINEKIQFELDKAVIRPESHNLLDEVVEVLRENVQLKKVDIIGHTSDEGADTYNQQLSEKRAKAVMEYLTSHGIDTKRLTAKGMGESEPIADNATERGKEKNRRVEFLIVEQTGASAKASEDGEKQPKKKPKKKEKSAKKSEKKTAGGTP